MDIDLLFNEGLTIGKKIGLTEKIVAVLQMIKCPHKIEPHQIQGLDFINIFPVVQWLVRKAIETRDAMGDIVRKYALSQYHRSFPEMKKDFTTIQIEGLKCIEQGYEPKRRYRQQEKLELDRESRVELTLLEYGKTVGSAIASTANTTKPSSKTANENIQEIEELPNVKLENLLQRMVDEQQNSEKLNINAVRSVMDLNSNNLSKASEQYKKLQEKLDAERQMENGPEGIRKSIQILENRNSILLSRTENIESEIKKTKINENLKSLRSEVVSLKRELETLEEGKNNIQLDNGDHECLKKMQSLITKNESLKKKESDFRKSCKQKIEEMVAKNNLLQKEIDSFDEVNTTKNMEGEINTEFEEQAYRLRVDLAHKSKIVSGLERRLDNIPSPYELAQYQRRFVELENQVSAEFSESQKFVILFNRLLDQKSFIEREVSLLESILENIPDVKYTNSSAKALFIDKLSRLLQGMDQSKNTLEKNLRDHEKKRQEAKDDLNKLLEEQRQYTLLVRDMKEEMKKNQSLMERIANPVT